jgi:hypothetical protein
MLASLVHGNIESSISRLISLLFMTDLPIRAGKAAAHIDTRVGWDLVLVGKRPGEADSDYTRIVGHARSEDWVPAMSCRKRKLSRLSSCRARIR